MSYSLAHPSHKAESEGDHCPCGRLDRPPCVRVGGVGECATTTPLRFVWTVSLGVEAETAGDAERLLGDLLGDNVDEWHDVVTHVAIYPPHGPPDDVVEYDDGPACTCPPEMVASGGFRSSCPACGY
jgi:hypothetical protein